MKYFDAFNFVRAIRKASYIPKRDFISARVIDKDVLDLGCVAHSLDTCLASPEQWLHYRICRQARSVLGVDLLEKEIMALRKMGYNVLAADVLKLRLDRQFDVIVCGDLIEHVVDLRALFDTISYHLRDHGICLLTTPNPFAINRFFNILVDGWTDINTEHVCWLCPQTMFQLVERSGFVIDNFYWLKTDFPIWTKQRFWKYFFNFLGPRIAGRNKLLGNDYGVVLRKRQSPIRSKLEWPFVSVIIPTYNRSYYLEKALRSLAEQDYPINYFEIIVVDNASTDNTRQRVQQLVTEVLSKNRVKYISERRQGLVFGRHTGAVHAQGDILLFGDDDAIFDNNWISAVVDVYFRYPEVGAVGTKICILWDDEPEPWVHRYEEILGKLDYGDRLLVQKGLYINGGSFSIRKQALLQVHGFNPGQKGKYIMGDSETGLCRKLARDKIMVGWTPNTTMWHLQRVAIHGTLQDLKRRFRNMGIADAYYAIFYNRGVSKLVTEVLRKTCRMLGKLFAPRSWRYGERWRYDMVLEIAYYLYYVKYLWLYRLNHRVRNEVMKRDWEFTPNYKAPPVVLFDVLHKETDSE